MSIHRAVYEPTQPFLIGGQAWIEVKDGDATGRALFHRHYSYKPYRDGRNPSLFVGPGVKVVLLTPCARALFVWRKFISGDGQEGINCSIFRNEGAGLASDLIREADIIADEKWPGERHYTYVNSRCISRTRQPGRCFIKAGWRYVMSQCPECGYSPKKKCQICHGRGKVKARTKHRRLHILERVA